MIHPNFNSIIGQNRAKTLLSAGISASDRGRDLFQPLITAPKGTGKTQIATGYLDALESKGFIVLRYSSPKELRLAGDIWDSFVEVITGDNPYALFFDEIHEVETDTTKNMNTLFAFFRKALDKTNRDRRIILTDGISLHFDRSVNVICGATNEPHIMDEAVRDRFDKIELDLYSEDQLKLILESMMKAEDLDAESDAVYRIIANCGRGTARPIRNIVDQLLTLYGNDAPVTYEQVLDALRLMSIFPKGLTTYEVDLLISATKQPLRDMQFLAMNPKVSAYELRFSKGYLTSPEVAFLTHTPSGMSTTDRGRKYIALLKQKGFLDAI